MRSGPFGVERFGVYYVWEEAEQRTPLSARKGAASRMCQCLPECSGWWLIQIFTLLAAAARSLCRYFETVVRFYFAASFMCLLYLLGIVCLSLLSFLHWSLRRRRGNPCNGFCFGRRVTHLPFLFWRLNCFPETVRIRTIVVRKRNLFVAIVLPCSLIVKRS